MTRRCPHGLALGPARLARHRFFIMENGYASIARDANAVVHGVLYQLALSDMGPLDRYEEVHNGLYAKITQPVFREKGGPVRALIYVGRESRAGRPAKGYLEAVAAAARAANLPPPYIEFLERQAAPGSWKV
ncbi:AIG2-like family protein [Methylocapsa palsarum]|uniref:AIG2-like family protein n=2 Tax=Methylocapsa palsarum TaxID=1612308 RepID=A0A1I3XIG8_9HYPH|nr:AIG2-like family protein [Methylocapsa palsarum]